MFLYKKTVASVEAHNANSRNTYKQEVNKFAAYSKEELKQSYLGLKKDEGIEMFLNQVKVKHHHHHKNRKHHS